MKCIECGKDVPAPLISICKLGQTMGIAMCPKCAEEELKRQGRG